MIALPGWLLTSAMTVAGLYPLARLLCRLCRTRPAVAHLIWLVLMAKLVVPPLIYWQWSLPQLSGVFSAPRTNSRPVALTEALATSAEIEPAEISTRARDPQVPIERSAYEPPPADFDPQSIVRWNLASVIFLLWSLGASATALGGLRALWLQRRALQTSQPAPDYLTRRVNELAAQIGIRPPRALIRQRLSSPVLCCAGPPRLLWPSAISDPHTVAHSDGVLAHELAHIKRHDHWIVYLELLAAIVCWWNPLFWLIRRQLHETRELACDAMALAVARQPRADYARELLSISTARQTTIILAPAFGAGLASRHFLKRRLTMVFDERVSPRTPAASVALLLALAAIALPAVTLAQQAVVSSASTDAEPAFVEQQPVSQSNSSTTTPALAMPTNDFPGTALTETPAPVHEDARAPGSRGEGQTAPSSATVATPITETTIRRLGRFDPSKTSQMALPGGGTLRLRKNDDGTIEVEFEQATVRFEQSSVQRRSDSTPSSRTPSSATYYAPGTIPPSGLSATVAVPQVTQNSISTPLPRSSTSSAAETYPTAASPSLSARDSLEKDMLRSDVDLAKVNLEEKMVQLEIARKDGSDKDRVHLAELAVRRAQIELDRAELQLKRGISASRR